MNAYCRRVTIGRMDSGNSFALVLIAFGLIILLAGCGVAVYREQESGKETELERDLDRMVSNMITDHSSGSGALSLSKLGSSDIDLVDGRSARVHVETMDGDVLVIFLPDEETFLEMENENNPSAGRTLPVVTADGRVLPGRLEVTLNG